MNEWKLFKDELPKPKTHILIKREYEDEVFAEWEDAELYEKVDYMTGILSAGILKAGDRNGTISIEITNDEIKNNYYWRYIDD